MATKVNGFLGHMSVRVYVNHNIIEPACLRVVVLQPHTSGGHTATVGDLWYHFHQTKNMALHANNVNFGLATG